MEQLVTWDMARPGVPDGLTIARKPKSGEKEQDIDQVAKPLLNDFRDNAHTADGRRKGRVVSDIDSHVGGRIRLRRTELGITQPALANDVGITFQQIQKYENGSNRVAAPFLWAISKSLGVKVDFFFQGLEETAGNEQKNPDACFGDRPIIKTQSLRLVRYFNALDPAQRSAVLSLVVSMSDKDAGSSNESELD